MRPKIKLMEKGVSKQHVAVRAAKNVCVQYRLNCIVVL